MHLLKNVHKSYARGEVLTQDWDKELKRIHNSRYNA